MGYSILRIGCFFQAFGRNAPSVLPGCLDMSPRLVLKPIRWSGSRPACLPLPFICLPVLFSFVSQARLGACVVGFLCPPLSVGHVAFLHLSPRSVTAGVRPFLQAMQHFYSFVSQVCHCWCPPFSVGHAAFLFISLPGLSLLVSALFRWRCNTSIFIFSRSVTAGVRPFLLAMQHFY